MLHFRSQPTEHDDKLPLEYPLRDALGIYLKRLQTFFIVVAVNLLVFLLFIGIQNLSVKFVYLLDVNIMFVFFFAFMSVILIFSFAYQRSNPVKGYLVFSDGTKETHTINLYTGWRITKKKLDRSIPPDWGIDVLTAKNIAHQRRVKFYEPNQIHIRLQYKYQNRVVKVDIVDGETKHLPDGIIVSYQQKAG